MWVCSVVFIVAKLTLKGVACMLMELAQVVAGLLFVCIFFLFGFYSMFCSLQVQYLFIVQSESSFHFLFFLTTMPKEAKKVIVKYGNSKIFDGQWLCLYPWLLWASSVIELSKFRCVFIYIGIPCSCSLNDHPSFSCTSCLSRWIPHLIRVLWLQTIKAIIDSCSFKSPKSDEPRRVQVLDFYCLTRFESESSSREIVY